LGRHCADIGDGHAFTIPLGFARRREERLAHRSDDVITFVQVTRLGVRDVWPSVAQGLDALYLEHKGPWMPEDVYAELMFAKVTLYLMKKDDVTKGFFIARANADFDGVVLFIWIMWAEPHIFSFEEVLPELDQLARSVGARRIRHESPREGWAKKGFDLTLHIFEREVMPCSTS
jgi:hypothetical protein